MLASPNSSIDRTMNASNRVTGPDNASRVYLIDASVYVFRAFFSLPETMENAAGHPINAIHGFAGFLADIKRRVGDDKVIGVAFDASLTTSFRNQIYPDYKANRPPAPESLKRQFAWCRELCEALRLPMHSDSEFEADDIIGHWANEARGRGDRVTIVSRDKDLTQLVRDGDTWWDFAADRHLDPAGVKEKMGVKPEQVADWLALTGDAVDNIPGVKGVGPKAATALLDAYSSLDEIYANLEGVATLPVRGARSLAAKLSEHEQVARMSRQLTKIPRSCPRVPELVREPRKADSNTVQAVLDQIGLGSGLGNRLRVFC